MFQPNLESIASPSERFRQRLGERLAGIVLTLLLEALVLFVIFSIGRSVLQPDEPVATVSTFRTLAVAADEPNTPDGEPEAQRARPAPPEQQPETEPPRPRPLQPPSSPTPPALIRLSPNQMAAADIASLPRRAAPERRPQMGPAAPPSVGDTPRVGSAPNGEPLYAAAWYREPTDDQLRGYLSTADGPGWGLIACRTVAEYRVEDCVALDEYPRNSHIARSALAAAWQFRVIPPRIGGRYQVGEWVRIRIEYTITRR